MKIESRTLRTLNNGPTKAHGDVSVEMPQQNPFKGEQWEKEKVAMASSPPRGENVFPPMAANRISSVQTEFLSSVKKARSSRSRVPAPAASQPPSRSRVQRASLVNATQCSHGTCGESSTKLQIFVTTFRRDSVMPARA